MKNERRKTPTNFMCLQSFGYLSDIVMLSVRKKSHRHRCVIHESHAHLLIYCCVMNTLVRLRKGMTKGPCLKFLIYFSAIFGVMSRLNILYLYLLTFS